MSEQSARGPAWERIRRIVLDRDGWICTSCRKPLEGSDATVDHDDAIANGGAVLPDPDECTSLCRSCNSTKGKRVLVRLNYVNPAWLARMP